MKKDRVYKIELQLEESSFEISAAQCGSPAGRGPRASCKHIAALCYALEEFEKVTRIPEFQTCTDKLQMWNQPRPRKLEPIPVKKPPYTKTGARATEEMVSTAYTCKL